MNFMFYQIIIFYFTQQFISQLFIQIQLKHQILLLFIKRMKEEENFRISQANEYLNKHRIIQLMQDLCSDLCYEQPEHQNISEFIIERLKVKEQQFKIEAFNKKQSSSRPPAGKSVVITKTPKIQLKLMTSDAQHQHQQPLNKAKGFCQNIQLSFSQKIADNFFEKGYIIQAIQIYQNIISTDPNYKSDLEGLGDHQQITSYYQWNVYQWYNKNIINGIIKSSPYDALSLCYYLIKDREDLKIYMKKGEIWYKAMLQKYPTNYGLYLGLGNLLSAIESYDQAIKEYDIVIQLQPQFTPSYISKAFIYTYKRQDKQKRKKICNKVLQLDPKNVYAAFLLAKNLENIDEKIQALKKLSQKVFDYPRLINQIGIAYGSGKKDYDQAIVYYKKCSEIAPLYHSLYNNIGVNYQLKKDYQQARKWYYQAIQIYPNYAEAYTNLSDVYNQIKFINQGIQSQVKSYPQISLNQYYTNLSEAFRKKTQLQKAEYWGQKAVKLFPESKQSWNKLAMIQQDLNQNFQALNSYQKAIQIDPLNYRYYYNKGIAYKKLKQMQNTIQMYEKAIQVNPRYSFAYNNLGNIYKDREEFQPAIQVYLKAIFYNSKYTLALANLGYCYLKTGKFKEAFTYFQQAQNALPNDNNNLSAGNKVYLKENLMRFNKEGDKWKKSGTISDEEKNTLQNLINEFQKKFSNIQSVHQKAKYPLQKILNDQVINIIGLLAKDKFQLNNFVDIFDQVQHLFHQDQDYFHIIPLLIANKFTSDVCQNQAPIMQVELDLKKLIKKLGQKLSVKLKEQSAEIIKPVQVKLDLCKATNQEINLFKDATYFQTYQELYVEIMKVNEDAKNSFYQFTQLVEAVRNAANGIPGGLGTKIPTKVADQFKVILRIMQKMFKKDINDQRTVKIIKNIDERLKKLAKINMNSVVRQIVNCWTDQITKILKERNEKGVQTQCYVSDLLRAKCYFRTIEDLLMGLKVADSLCQSFGYEIIQLDNRLTKPQTKDVVLKILIKKAVCQFQLAIKQDQSLTHLDHSVYQIMRSPLGCIFGSYLYMSKSVKYPFSANCKDIIEFIQDKNQHEKKQIHQELKSHSQYVFQVLIGK